MSAFIVNSTAIPNAFIDEAMAHLTDKALRVYLAIIRKTTGWQKFEDAISASQLKSLTGIKDARTIRKAARELVQKGLIITSQSSGFCTVYAPVRNVDFNIEPPTCDAPPAPDDTPRTPCTEPPTCDAGGPPTCHAPNPPHGVYPTKETIQKKDKERVTKEKGRASKTGSQSKFIPPSFEELAEEFQARASEKNLPLDATDQAERFFDHYQANGWMAGKNKMKDWRAAIRNWLRRSADFAGSKQGQNPAPASNQGSGVSEAQLAEIRRHAGIGQ